MFDPKILDNNTAKALKSLPIEKINEDALDSFYHNVDKFGVNATTSGDMCPEPILFMLKTENDIANIVSVPLTKELCHENDIKAVDQDMPSSIELSMKLVGKFLPQAFALLFTCHVDEYLRETLKIEEKYDGALYLYGSRYDKSDIFEKTYLGEIDIDNTNMIKKWNLEETDKRVTPIYDMIKNCVQGKKAEGGKQ